MDARGQTRDISVSHVGPALDARGGISSVLRTLAEDGSFPGYSVRFLATADGRAGLVSAVAGTLRAGSIAAGSWFRPRGIYHIHVASRGSFYRKAIIAVAARVRGHVTVLHLHGAQFHQFAAQSGPMLRRTIAWVFRSSDAVIVLSPEWSDRVAEFSGRSDSLVVPNPVSVPEVPSDGRDDSVVFFGRIGARKGVPDLVEAIGRLQSEGFMTTRWTIAGDGDPGAIEEVVSALPDPDTVSLPGWLSHDDVQALLSHARVFCLPSYDEGKPVALLEAMAFGLACVATPVGGVPDLLDDDVNGLLVEPGDVEGLAAALRRCISDEALRRRLGSAARSTVAEKYSVVAVSSALVAMYDSLLGGRGR